MSVHDASGALVDSIDLGDLGSGKKDFSWDGTLANGEQLPPGAYTITADALVGGERRAIASNTYNWVSSVSVDRENNSITLNLVTGGTMSLPEVHEFK